MTFTLNVKNLVIQSAEKEIVHGATFNLEAGKSLAIIGESGSGKTLTARAIADVLPTGIHKSGEVKSNGKVVLLLQDPFTSLSPVHTCGEQISWAFEPASKVSKNEVLKLLKEVQLPERVSSQYPHELSGGMRQRVAIAAAIAANPDLLIADEPTSALDASNQNEILELLRRIQLDRGMTLILISHDLGLVRSRADQVLVMRNGEIVEAGSANQVFESPQAQYTKDLLAASPSIGASKAIVSRVSKACLRVEGLNKSFRNRQVLGDASIEVAKGEIVSVVGESGSGKTTLARCIAGLEVPDSGVMTLAEKPLGLGRKNRDPKDIQIVFQDPYSTLNPFFTIQKTLSQALEVANRNKKEVSALLELVGLDPAIATRRPRQLSGGQRQRIAIARAIALNPKLLICDEAVSALDVTIQAQILELLLRLRDELEISILFISHDIAVVSRISDFIYVLHEGQVVESNTPSQLLASQSHPATARLVSAARQQTL